MGGNGEGVNNTGLEILHKHVPPFREWLLLMIMLMSIHVEAIYLPGLAKEQVRLVRHDCCCSHYLLGYLYGAWLQ